ncbi:MAG TPA: hypothetical protein VGM18_05080 [Candidatus Sulfotelmatobacter sp.]|jgi:hypothetical protein
MNRRLLLPGPLFVRVAIWLFVFALSPLPAPVAQLSFQLEVLGRTTVAALPPRSAPVEAQHLTEKEHTQRILLYLEHAEKKEIDPWLRDDIRIAWITTLEASRGNSQPHVDATYRVLGVHPDQVWTRIVARRKALLGSEYEDFFGGVSSPKKPVRSVSLGELRGRRTA